MIENILKFERKKEYYMQASKKVMMPNFSLETI